MIDTHIEEEGIAVGGAYSQVKPVAMALRALDFALQNPIATTTQGDFSSRQVAQGSSFELPRRNTGPKVEFRRVR